MDQPTPTQRIIKIRRDYNTWVADETLEDYALRFTPRSFRKWSEMRVANTAFGAASFLVLEAVGATMLVNAGFINAFWAILATGLIIFLLGLPISVTAARHGLDMDLLTRGAGFGYIGSTITSLIYASFTFIFFALEAAIMAYALELAFGIPPAWGYLVCALVAMLLVPNLFSSKIAGRTCCCFTICGRGRGRRGSMRGCMAVAPSMSGASFWPSIFSGMFFGCSVNLAMLLPGAEASSPMRFSKPGSGFCSGRVVITVDSCGGASVDGGIGACSIGLVSWPVTIWADLMSF